MPTPRTSSNKKNPCFPYLAEGEKRSEGHRSPLSLRRAAPARGRDAGTHKKMETHLFYSLFYEFFQGCVCICTSIWKRAFFSFFFMEIPAFVSIQTRLLLTMP